MHLYFHSQRARTFLEVGSTLTARRDKVLFDVRSDNTRVYLKTGEYLHQMPGTIAFLRCANSGDLATNSRVGEIMYGPPFEDSELKIDACFEVEINAPADFFDRVYEAATRNLESNIMIRVGGSIKKGVVSEISGFSGDWDGRTIIWDNIEHPNNAVIGYWFGLDSRNLSIHIDQSNHPLS